MKRRVPLVITFLAGVIIVVTFFIPHEPFGSLEQRLLIWASIIGGFAALLGIDNLIKHHLSKLFRRERGWFYSLVTLVGIFGTLASGIVTWIIYGTPLALLSGLKVGGFLWVYNWIIVPLQGTMFSLLAFFIASAAYRAFRARTFDALLLMSAAILVMLGHLSIGLVPALVGALLFALLLVTSGVYRLFLRKLAAGIILIVIGLAVGVLAVVYRGMMVDLAIQVKEWVMGFPQLAARRGILIGLVLGGIAMSVRLILGIERTYISST
ncbi:hypothetical protein JXM67_14090 [candidate division WOR-3 bacterium]|nr:hypothetical protein [candidate division WOR-3 bacterium]